MDFIPVPSCVSTPISPYFHFFLFIYKFRHFPLICILLLSFIIFDTIETHYKYFKHFFLIDFLMYNVEQSHCSLFREWYFMQEKKTTKWIHSLKNLRKVALKMYDLLTGIKIKDLLKGHFHSKFLSVQRIALWEHGVS